MPKRKTEAQRYPFKFAAKGSTLDAAAKAVMEADGQWLSTPWNKIDRIDRIWYTRLAEAALDASKRQCPCEIGRELFPKREAGRPHRRRRERGEGGVVQRSSQRIRNRDRRLDEKDIYGSWT